MRTLLTLAFASFFTSLTSSSMGRRPGGEGQDYLSVKPHGDTLLHVNHRFALGHSLKRDPAFITFSSEQLQMTGDIEAQVPASIPRIRPTALRGTPLVDGDDRCHDLLQRGAAVHETRTGAGGADSVDGGGHLSLDGRSSDIYKTPVKIVTETDKITTGQITIMLFQQEPVREKVKARRLVAGLYAGNTLISDEVTVDCSQASPEARDRFYPLTLTLSRGADTFVMVAS